MVLKFKIKFTQKIHITILQHRAIVFDNLPVMTSFQTENSCHGQNMKNMSLVPKGTQITGISVV